MVKHPTRCWVGSQQQQHRARQGSQRMTFAGFSTEGLVSLPPEWFSEVVPAITLPSELKITLHIFYRLSQQQGTPRRISWDMLLRDALLQRSLRALSKVRPPADLLAEGLDAAVQRTTLLHLAQPEQGRVVNWYLVHTASNRAWCQAVQAGTLAIGAAPDQQQAPLPTIVQIYEQNIGLVTPLLLDELQTAEARYPAAWIEAAIREAVRSNVRSWRYIQKVLERWAANGRPATDTADQSRRSEIDVERYVSGTYRHLFRQSDSDSDTSDGA